MGREPRDRVRAEIRRLLTAGVTGFVFPGGAGCVSFRDPDGREQLVVGCAGTLAKGEARVQERTPYDLAALTECFVAMAALRLEARRVVDLDESAESLLPDVRGGVLGETSVRDLLRHRGGLAAWGGLYLDVPHDVGSVPARRWIVSEAARRPSEARSPQRSDLGYIVAGEAMARAAGTSLDEVVRQEVLEPLGVEDEVSYPGTMAIEKRADFARQAPPTERCEWRGRRVRGETQDENAAALGGVAGHAGLFGTAQAVGLFGRALLDSLRRRGAFLPAAAVRAALADPGDGSPLRLGFVRRERAGGAWGRRMGPRSFGQLGITGTSLFCDPDKDVVVVLLTNRICPSRVNEKIDGFRPAFHDGVLAALE